ncbi:HAMP domain-containing sensor histidine kinase [Anaeromyxobacter oryzisoli]|uniref:HAMP domain-containing sensor histidine kinase n=1 Tax=Anaeromyxobacter oryzisoli TaxID=2925408 RepID=UPI001F565D89|nr:HAMP domain-containing sensor histidine kinase [Anaeromyxobacter sp. SG63]
MTEPTRRGPYGLALRIYVVTVVAVLATAAALALALALARERRQPPRHGLVRDLAGYAAERLSARWSDEAGLREELAALASGLHVRTAVYRLDGALVAAAPSPGPAPLSAAEREVLARAGTVERGEPAGSPRAVAVPVRAGAGAVGYLVVEATWPFHGPPLPPELISLALVLVGTGVAAVVLGGSIARPLDRLARTAKALGAGDLRARTGLARRDELGAVARAFDEMADRLQGLLHAQTELIANVAHELRTPLARIHVALDLAADGDAAVARESLAEIGEDLAELEGLVSDILSSARMELASGDGAGGGALPLHRAALDVAAVVEQAVERLRVRHPGRRVDVALEPGLPVVEGDASLLRRALDNLLENARKYSPPDAGIRVAAARRDGQVAIEVIDRGEGIAPADLERVFAPFFRADRSRTRATGGVGLGLTLARRIVEAHGGTLVARSAPGSGTTMTIALPVRS